VIERTVIVVNGMTGQENHVKVRDGATPKDVLRQLNLGGYNLARVRDRKLLPRDLDISRNMRDRERLFAFAPMEVGGNA